MFHQQDAPVGGQLWLSALVALLPLLTIFVMLGVFKVQIYWAALSSLAVALIVAITAFRMPTRLALLSGTEGVTYGLIPIMWILINAIWLYQLTVRSGRSEDLRDSFRLVSDDPRIQAIIIAFCFGGLLEALAGFGAPLAITGVMMMALGFSAVRAATVVLLANTAPVAFGAIGTPVLASAAATKIPLNDIAKIVESQCRLLAVIVPLLLVIVVDGKRGLRQTWPIALVAGVSFASAQYYAAHYGYPELGDVFASLTALLACVLFLQVWKPTDSRAASDTLRVEHEQELRELVHSGGSGSASGGGGSATGGGGSATGGGGSATGGGGSATVTRPTAAGEPARPSAGRISMAFLPYLIIIAVFWMCKKYTPLTDWLTGTEKLIHWPGLNGHVVNANGTVSTLTIFKLTWLDTPGTELLFSALIVMLIYRISPLAGVKEFGAVLNKLKFAMLTVTSLLALAYVMNISGQTTSIGKWIAAAGASFAFFSPILGWLGVALTGSDTSAAALFGGLQQTVGRSTGINPTLLVAANNSGGVLGKMISPQNLTIVATAVGLAGKESIILRKIILWSLGMLLFMCILVYLQSTPVLSWMVG
jgi:lactate permease